MTETGCSATGTDLKSLLSPSLIFASVKRNQSLLKALHPFLQSHEAQYTRHATQGKLGLGRKGVLVRIGGMP
jgi:hypothetical protein